MDNKIKKDESKVIGFFDKKGITVYSVEDYREVLRSEIKKEDDYALKINKKFKPIWRKSDFDVNDDLPEHCIGFVYIIFTEKNILSKPIELLNKEFWISPVYVGYATDPKRPIEHVDKRTDSIFDYTNAVKNNSSDNLYVAILACKLTQQYARDIEAIFQKIFRCIQLPGGRIGEDYQTLRNSRKEKPSSVISFSKFEDFTENFKHQF